MFIPLSDNVKNRSIPVAGTFLLLGNLLVYAFEFRTMSDFHEQTYISELIDFFKTWGLVPRSLEEDEQYAGLFTYMFMHGNFMHLLGNMVVFWAFVRSLENQFGSVPFFFLYIFWGLAAGVSHTVAEWGSDRPLVGASGAVSGLIGAYLVAFGLRTNIKTLTWFFGPRVIEMPALVYIGFWLTSQVVGIMDDAESGQSHVAWFCHLGGFGAGAITMLLCKGQTERKLVLNSEGEYVFVNAKGEEEVTEEPKHNAPKNTVLKSKQADNVEVATCPHCDAPVTKKDIISSALLHCPNPNCRRLTYLS